MRAILLFYWGTALWLFNFSCSSPARNSTGEHLPSDKLAFGFACRTGRFCRPVIRVWRRVQTPPRHLGIPLHGRAFALWQAGFRLCVQD